MKPQTLMGYDFGIGAEVRQRVRYGSSTACRLRPPRLFIRCAPTGQAHSAHRQNRKTASAAVLPKFNQVFC
jgi:hypothetical protein